MIFKFFGELNDFLTTAQHDGVFEIPLTRRAGVKDVIEAQGVPHTEVGAVAIDGVLADWSTVLEPGNCAHISVYPNPRGHESTLRAPLPAPPRFVLDVHLGRLARYLRLLGLDTDYAPERDDAVLAAIADQQARILLTRDRGLLKRARVVFARFVRADDALDQLEDVFVHFRLAGRIAPFSRCSRCNTPLETVAKAAIEHRLEPGTRRHYTRFSRCPDCGRLFWRGSHHRAMQARIDALTAPDTGDGAR